MKNILNNKKYLLNQASIEEFINYLKMNTQLFNQVQEILKLDEIKN